MYWILENAVDAVPDVHLILVSYGTAKCPKRYILYIVHPRIAYTETKHLIKRIRYNPIITAFIEKWIINSQTIDRLFFCVFSIG